MNLSSRPLAALAALALAALPATGAAQLPQTQAGTPLPHGASADSIAGVPPGPAAVRGRVIHEPSARGIAGIPVVLYAMPAGGMPGIRGLVTDESGAFAFEAIANDPTTVYLLGARYAEIPFGLRFSFEPDELVREIELPVSDATADTSRAEVGEVRLEVEEGCANLTVRETYRLENRGGDTIFVGEPARASAEPILRATLPPGAIDLQFGVGSELARDGDSLSFWGPLRPGEHDIELSYALPARGEKFEIARTFPSGARRLALVERPGGPRLARDGDPNAAIRPGDSIALRGERAAAKDLAAKITAPEARIWLELDGAAIVVEQQYTLAAEGGDALLAGAGPPLLCIDVPDGADDLRLSSEALAMGVSRDASGALAFRGPLPAGESQLALHFLLPIERSDPLYSQTMPLDVSLLSVLVADTGVAPETSRLHQKRPIRTPDRNYLHLEAFEIPAGESVEIGLRPLEARRPLPKPAAAGAVLAAAALAVGFLIAPLRRAGEQSSVPPSDASRAAEQRESVLTAIRGLEEDFEVGKLSESNYREMRDALRAEAVDLLRAERAALDAAEHASDAASARADRICARCDAAAASDARFCSQCGAPLDPGGVSPRADARPAADEDPRA